ncbi:solute carrier organic anion transporter family member 74D-like [Wyeomyia smithii]|uniref:solute carrier organic anion transporter family member 74D-like n=1 Tax=Wyeomyia smithii TaxID=174621 RepID=UPI002467B7FD|nr:solute carrier organic anion transporter family member 74D-like [Wyeomyia smithii]
MLTVQYRPEDVQCGLGFCRGRLPQRLASKKLYVILFSFLNCMMASAASYFYGTLTTVEKSLQISSKNVGMITAGGELSFLMSSLFLSHYAANKRKPPWIAFGVLSVALSCFVSALPHFIAEPNLDNALRVDLNISTSNIEGNNLCDENRPPPDCSSDVGNLIPQLLLLLGTSLSGLGTSLYATLGITYLDDNVKKEKVPFLSSVSSFGRNLGPMVGFSLASLCLKLFIVPGIEPPYENSDPRWIGAWWLGWIVLGSVILLAAPLFASFPRMLPRAAERRLLEKQDTEADTKSASWRDFFKTFKRLITNKVYLFNNIACVFYCYGAMPYLLFQTKYLEIQYQLTPSQANMVTGSVSLVFAALGILIAGAVVQKLKPSARQLAGWNILTGVCAATAVLLYSVLGCNNLNNTSIIENSRDVTCFAECNCEFVKYAPICGADGNTYISPCHAGCREQINLDSGSTVFSDCACINKNLNISVDIPETASTILVSCKSFRKYIFLTIIPQPSGTATSGGCPIDCRMPFFLFLLVMCLNKFIDGTESASNFLIALRCVREQDKPFSMGLSMTINRLGTFLPAPIIFGIIIDRTCLLWGRSCDENLQGNCWLYDGLELRTTMNYFSAAFILTGASFDVGTWYYAKNLKIFNDDRNVRNSAEEVNIS